MHRLFRRQLLLVLLVFASVLHGQVPNLISYQGRIAVGVVNFEGSGLFKFALLNTNGSTTYWSNDGTSTAGSEPSAAVTLTVTKGLYSVLLGYATLPNMTIVPATVFTNADVRLRVWFNDGTNGSQLLTPDQRIAAVGYALMAGSAATVADGAITSANIASGAVGASQLTSGAAQANLNAGGFSAVPRGGMLLSSAPNDPNLTTAGYGGAGVLDLSWQSGEPSFLGVRHHTAVWTGSVIFVWGGIDHSNAVSSNLRSYNPATNTWTAVATAGAPSARSGHTALWMGSEMIVWGGDNNASSKLNDGGRYNPATSTWTAVATAGAPSARNYHTALWTGSEMIVWGGYNNASSKLNDGGRYNPAINTWAVLSTAGAPSARSDHTAVWAGSDMIVWGGNFYSDLGLNDGGR